MARLARFTFVVADPTTGLPVSGASVEVRSQGATVNGDHAGGVTSFTVNNPGAVAVTNTVVIDATSLTPRAVTSITATNVTVGGLGFFDIDDNQRISIALPLPTLYNDASGDGNKTNPLTTDANGLAECWIVGSNFDVLVSKSGVLTTTLYEDVASVGGEVAQSNVHNSGSIPAWVLDSLRTLDDGQPILTLRNAGTDKHRFFADGSWRSVKGGTIDAGGLTITAGGLTLSASTITTPSITASAAGSAIIASTGNILATSGAVKTSRYFGNSGTQIGSGDIALGGDWGTTPSKGVAATSYDSRGAIQITSGSGSPGANPTFAVTFADGTYTTAPVVVVARGDSNSPSDATWSITNNSNTSFTVTFIGTPAASTAYVCRYVVLG